ncbi:hypothetical protein P154DRAFT_421339 [Amniculicola lignicola CBS 123094]|uniref:Transcription factor domain-containing protein n=1 Tax=Amniculicola lignicola CBS 123094 TaxID=1392246 RepID=A0A6A5WZT1_9PLEO|nr:hypothetical protein P154DRAFT_421339 [Amniculicola lignicola CBS 123094]
MPQFGVSHLPNMGSHVLDFEFNAGVDSIDAMDDFVSLEEHEQPDNVFSVVKADLMLTKALSAAQLSPPAQSRLNYAIEQVKLAPTMMAKQNHTVWSHPFLYAEHMPRCVQDAQSACALYLLRNDTNVVFLARYINDHVQDIMGSPIPSSTFELLAQIHALMLYQIIRIFSDDIRFHYFSDGASVRLQDAGLALYTLLQHEVDPIGPLPVYPSDAARAAWRSFIFRESARRTLLSLFQFISVSTILHGDNPACCPELALTNRVTFSSHLWSAPSAFDFAMAWNQKNHFLVRGLDVAELLESAQPDDIDVFGRVILTGMLGIDDVKGWFHTKGGAF